MSGFRAALLGGCALAWAAVAIAQTPLPAGVIQQGNVITMAPVSDSEGGLDSGSERRIGLVRILSLSDHGIYDQAFSAADRGDWIAAKGLAAQGHDATANKLIQWRYLLDRNSGASFQEIAAFLQANPQWPKRDTLYARAEKALSPATDPRAVIAFFGDRDPVTGLGNVRLGEALIATGSISRGREEIQKGWIDGSFEPADEFDIISRHGDALTPDVDARRLNQLLLRNEISAAKRELARVSAAQQQIGQLRLLLKTNPAAGLRAASSMASLPTDDPGLDYDLVRAYRRQNDNSEIAALLTRAPVHDIADEAPAAWWAELNLATRSALQNRDYHTAYRIAANTGLTPQTTAASGTEYSEAQFLAGWIALRFLSEPATALPHFRQLGAAVGRPISKSRAFYWEGRAHEAAGDNAAAYEAYRNAAAYPETFYGQLATAKTDTTPHLRLNSTDIDAATAAYERDDLSAPIRILADLGQENLLRLFAVQDATAYPAPAHVKALCEDLVRMGFREIAVRVAKQASYGGTYFVSYLYPTLAVPAYRGTDTAPDQALVLGIIRQETEFDPTAVSGAGARGIMQMMTDSARKAASEGNLPYRPNDLLSDPTYNMELGTTELGHNISTWGGSLPISAAAYNAGPGNASRWLNTYGDPRSPATDPIDWIESIPFSETRNYVQRVLENTEVYRVRLGGNGVPLQIMRDVYYPRTADIRVLRTAP